MTSLTQTVQSDNGAMTIENPTCAWCAMPFKDKRKGFFWLCRACGFKTKGRHQPDCACKVITVSAALTSTGENDHG